MKTNSQITRAAFAAMIVIFCLIAYPHFVRKSATNPYKEISTTSLCIVDKDGRRRGTFGVDGDGISLRLHSSNHLSTINISIDSHNQIGIQMVKMSGSSDTNYQAFVFQTVTPNDVMLSIGQAPSFFTLRSRNSKTHLELTDSQGNILWNTPEQE